MKYDYIIFIGRLRPPHLAHIQIIKEGLKLAQHVIVLVGSAYQPRTIKNPFTWQECEEMVRASLPDHLADRVTVGPLRDKLYNDQAWATQVQDVVHGYSYANGKEPSFGIIGHSKDESSYYLSMFPQWDLVNVDNIEDIHATDIRTAMFTAEDEDDFDLKIGRNLPAGIHDWLRAFMMTSEFEQLKREYVFTEAYKKAWEGAPYAPTFVTVDAVVIQSAHVLLVRRRSEPGKGLWALPGGFLNPTERLRSAVVRELREETKIKVPEGILTGKANDQEPVVFDHPGRSLRGRTITHAFFFELAPGPLPKVKGADDAEKAKWVPLSTFQKMEDQMFEDHYHIVNYFLGEG